VVLPEAAHPIRRMADGTVKQTNPFSGTSVWTIPGRANRPLAPAGPPPERIETTRLGAYCAFCPGRYLESPPERMRSAGGRWRYALPPAEVTSAPAEFRVIPNLFQILDYSYWHDNHGYEIPPPGQEHAERYLASALGRDHVRAIARTRALAGGMPEDEWDALGEDGQLDRGRRFFGSCHDVVVARRHYTDDAELTSDLAGSGTLTPDEHEEYMRVTLDGAAALYTGNVFAAQVVIFQNWLRPAGASFDHLHKQLVAIDEIGVRMREEIERVRQNPWAYNDFGVAYPRAEGLLIAENEHAIAIAGYGHRYPSLEVYSRSAAPSPWQMSPAELRGWSDLVHACHVAAGPLVPCNEEWHYRPPGVEVSMPLRAVVKWRISTLAGFEGGTKINVNTIDPWTMRSRAVAALTEALQEGRIAEMALGDDCPAEPLRYVG
jgi:galactose-1-phosphate uridylyltransferase